MPKRLSRGKCLPSPAPKTARGFRVKEQNHETSCSPTAVRYQASHANALERQLLEAGVTPELLMAQWGITLWSIKPKEGRIKAKVEVHPEAHQSLDCDALARWLETILGQPVSIKQSAVSNCCQSHCKGCLWIDPEKRAFWGRSGYPTAGN
jgi:hypothetical protein